MNKQIVLAAGCFWGTQEYYRRLDGVISTRVGYAQGETENPEYKDVKAQTTGHAEVCEIVYDPEVISLDELLQNYFKIIDPTTLNKQGHDIGTSYRTGIYPNNELDLEFCKSYVYTKQADYEKPIVVEVELLDKFWDAEDYHQEYLIKNPTGYCHIDFSIMPPLKGK